MKILFKILMFFPWFKNEAVKESQALLQKVHDSNNTELENSKKELKNFLHITGITRNSLKRQK